MRVLIIALSLSGLYGQQLSSEPAFEVATIKPAPPITPAMAAAGEFHVGMKADQAHVDIGYASLTELIRIAYGVKLSQVSGPQWMADRKWDVLAKIPDGVPAAQIPQMLQALLAERFGLTVHRESRQTAVYTLEVAKGGAKLKASPDELQGLNSDQNAAADPKPLRVVTSRDSTVTSGGGYGITKTAMQPDGSMHMESSRMSLSMLCEALSYYLDRPVIDMTHLTGSYTVELEFSAADIRFAYTKAGAAAYAPAAEERDSGTVGADLISSVQKLGLRLESRQMPIEIIVVDRLEKMPSTN